MKARFHGVALAALVSMLATNTASAMAWNDTARPLPEPDRDAYVAAAGVLKSTLDGADKPPTLADPAVSNFLDQSLALSRVLGTPAMPASDVSDFFEICMPASDIFVAYMQVGGEAVDDNLTRYRDEALPSLLFAIHCMSSYMPAMEAFGRAGGDRLSKTQIAGAREMRGGLFKIVNTVGEMIGAGAFTSDYPERFVDLLAQDAELIAAPLTLQQRRTLASQYKGLARIAPTDQKSRYDRFVAALGSSDCQVLCSY